MEWLVSALSSSGLGAILGVAGGIAQKFMDLKAKRLEYSHEEAIRRLDITESKLERSHELEMADKHMERAQVEGSVAIEQVEAAGWAKSQDNAGKNTVLTYIRAAITVYMLALATLVTVVVWHHAGGISSFEKEALIGLLSQIINTILFLAVTCVTWWFAARDGNLKFKL